MNGWNVHQVKLDELEGNEVSAASSVLILSLVHPDYLAPLYSIARLLRDLGRDVTLFSFSSPVPSRVDLGERIEMFDMGPHVGSHMRRFQARRRFNREVLQWSTRYHPSVIIASCPFSLLLALRVSGGEIPVVYISFEMYDMTWRDFGRSPGTALRSWRARRSLRKVSLICTPSDERSDWLFHRARLLVRPTTVLNAPYASARVVSKAAEPAAVSSFLPRGFQGRPLVLHTGNCSRTQAVLELVESMRWWPQDAALVITSVGETAYARHVRELASLSARSEDILLLPRLPRSDMLTLQRSADIGVALLRSGDNLESSMPAPNKVGEYLHAGLLIVGVASPYMAMLAERGVAVLSPTLEPEAIGSTIASALNQASAPDTRPRILDAARSWYDMSEQFQPVLRHLYREHAGPSAGWE
jgi:hypothetical protein